MAMRSELLKDLAGETKAIKDYGVRKKEAAGTPLAKILAEIQKDEQDHHRRLLKALEGLNGARPVEKELDETPEDVEVEEDEDVEVEDENKPVMGKGMSFIKKPSR
jgi:rubrerythrin